MSPDSSARRMWRDGCQILNRKHCLVDNSRPRHDYLGGGAGRPRTQPGTVLDSFAELVLYLVGGPADVARWSWSGWFGIRLTTSCKRPRARAQQILDAAEAEIVRRRGRWWFAWHAARQAGWSADKIRSAPIGQRQPPAAYRPKTWPPAMENVAPPVPPETAST